MQIVSGNLWKTISLLFTLIKGKRVWVIGTVKGKEFVIKISLHSNVLGVRSTEVGRGGSHLASQTSGWSSHSATCDADMTCVVRGCGGLAHLDIQRQAYQAS